MEIEDSKNDIRLWIPSPVYEEIWRNDYIHKALFETHEPPPPSCPSSNKLLSLLTDEFIFLKSILLFSGFFVATLGVIFPHASSTDSTPTIQFRRRLDKKPTKKQIKTKDKTTKLYRLLSAALSTPLPCIYITRNDQLVVLCWLRQLPFSLHPSALFSSLFSLFISLLSFYFSSSFFSFSPSLFLLFISLLFLSIFSLFSLPPYLFLSLSLSFSLSLCHAYFVLSRLHIDSF